MSFNFDRLHKFLYDNKDSAILENNYLLYKTVVMAEKDGVQSSFDNKFCWELFYNCAYRYHLIGGFANKKKVPYNIKKDVSFDEFCNEFYKYREIKNPSNIIPNDTMFDLLCRRFSRVTGSDDNWCYYNRSVIEGVAVDESVKTHKIYLSVDNKDLHNFALQLINKCDDLDINYDFKINSDDNYRRYDNVVIYASDSNFSKYISAIEAIKEENPNMDFGNGHIFAYNYNDYISVAPCEESSSRESHTSSLCIDICKLYSSEKNFSTFCDKVDRLMVAKLQDTADFCDKVKKSDISNKQEFSIESLTAEEKKKFVCVNETLNMLRKLVPSGETIAAIKSFEDYLKQHFPQYNSKMYNGSETGRNSIQSSGTSVTGKKK